MGKRIAKAVAVVVAMVILGSALVGFDIIPAEAGLGVWVVGIIAGVVVFLKDKPKD